MLWFFRYFISKFKIRQIGGSRKPIVNVIVIFVVIIKKKAFYLLIIYLNVKPNIVPFRLNLNKSIF